MLPLVLCALQLGAPATVIFGSVRVQLVSGDLLRIEQEGTEGFEDRPTFTIVDRMISPVRRTVVEDGRIKFGAIEVDVPGRGEKVDGTTVSWNGKVVFTVPKGGIPDPAFFPGPASNDPAWAFADTPRIIPPAWGATPPPDDNDPNSGWDLGNDAPDLYVFLHQPGDYRRTRSEFLRLTGRVPMPPLFAFGFIDSRYHPYTEEEALDSIDTYRRKQIPLDVFVVDTDWRVNGSHGYTPAPKYFPDMPRFLREAHDRDVRIMFNDHPEPQSSNALDPKELQYRWNGLTTLKKEGVDVWWYDRNWGVSIATPVPGLRHEVWGQRVYHDITQRAAPDQRPLIMTNVDGIDGGNLDYPPHPASHRFPIWWTGDTPAVWQSLQKAISNGVNEGVVGLLPYVNDDLGGHYDTPDAELYTRYLEYGCLCPITRVHCTRGQDRHPWAFGLEVERIVKNYIGLRYRLLPTIYSASHENFETGEPLLRRLDLEWPQFPEAGSDHEYLLGHDLLVAPISESIEGEPQPIDPNLLHTPDGRPGLQAEYFANQNLEGDPAVRRIDPNVDFYWADNAPMPGIPQEHFSVRWSGTIGPLPSTGRYELTSIADDGVRVYLDGKAVIDEWHDSDSVPIKVAINLAKGSVHSLKVEFYQNLGKSRCQLELRTPAATRRTDASRQVWIPPGEWQDAWTGRRVVGPQTLTVSSPLWHTPMWVRDGGVVTLTRVVQHTTDAWWRDLTLDAYVPRGSGSQTRTIYEDDGTSNHYLRGGSFQALVRFAREGNRFVVQLDPGAGRPRQRAMDLDIRLHLPKGTILKGVKVRNAVLTARPVGRERVSSMPLGGEGSGARPDEGTVVEMRGRIAPQSPLTLVGTLSDARR